MARIPSTLVRSLGLTGGLIVAALAGGCQPSEPWTSDNPEFALGAFLSALHMGDEETITAFLSEQTLETLGDNLERTRRLLGRDPDRPANPVHALYRVWSPSASEIDHLETLDQSPSQATVAIHTVYGRQTEVTLIRTDGRWVIPLLADDSPLSPEPP